LVGADHLLPDMQADILIADKAFDAEQRILEPVAAAGKSAVIPPKANRTSPREYDQHLYNARHLIENFFANWSNSAPSRPATIKRRATFSPPSTSPLALCGSIGRHTLMQSGSSLRFRTLLHGRCGRLLPLGCRHHMPFI
jgi:hypothetical protein